MIGIAEPRQGDLNVARLADLPHRYSQFDVTLAWEVRAGDNETVFEGILKNNRYAFMDDIEVWIAATDAFGKTKARAVCHVMPHQVRQNGMVAFNLKLPLKIAAGTVLKFTYKYQGTDGGEGAGNWVQSFEWVMPAGDKEESVGGS